MCWGEGVGGRENEFTTFFPRQLSLYILSCDIATMLVGMLNLVSLS